MLSVWTAARGTLPVEEAATLSRVSNTIDAVFACTPPSAPAAAGGITFHSRIIHRPTYTSMRSVQYTLRSLSHHMA